MDPRRQLARDRVLVLTGAALLAALAWAYTAYLAWAMHRMAGAGEMDMPGMLMPMKRHWSAWDGVLGFVMWSVMMVAMMVPSVSPTLLLFAKVNRARRERDDPFVPTFVFLAGYLAAWTAFSAVATALQAALHAAAVLSPDMRWTHPVLGGAILAATGFFQWSRLKRACLTHCRSPLDVLMKGWREGHWGAFRMGVEHGFSCLGCCWALMVLLLVLGVMNLAWVAALSAFVLIEKAARGGVWLSRASGVLLVAAGAWMALH